MAFPLARGAYYASAFSVHSLSSVLSIWFQRGLCEQEWHSVALNSSVLSMRKQKHHNLTEQPARFEFPILNAEETPSACIWHFHLKKTCCAIVPSNAWNHYRLRQATGEKNSLLCSFFSLCVQQHFMCRQLYCFVDGWLHFLAHVVTWGHCFQPLPYVWNLWAGFALLLFSSCSNSTEPRGKRQP